MSKIFVGVKRLNQLQSKTDQTKKHSKISFEGDFWKYPKLGLTTELWYFVDWYYSFQFLLSIIFCWNCQATSIWPWSPIREACIWIWLKDVFRDLLWAIQNKFDEIAVEWTQSKKTSSSSTTFREWFTLYETYCVTTGRNSLRLSTISRLNKSYTWNVPFFNFLTLRIKYSSLSTSDDESWL